MADVPYDHGARVLTSDGQLVGSLEKGADPAGASESAILVRHDSRLLRIPHSMINLGRSTADTVVLTESFQLPSEIDDTAETTIPVHAEQLNIHVTERNQGKVRIEKSVEQVPVHEDVELGMHVLDIEHVPSGEEFDEMPQSWHDGDTLVIPVVEEVLVLTRRFRVVENVRVTRRREVRTERVEAELRREVISVHEEDADGNLIEPET